jgi:hypothetical protein
MLPRGCRLAEKVKESNILDVISRRKELEEKYEKEINKLGD